MNNKDIAVMKLFKAYILKDSSDKDSFSPSQKALNKGILVDTKCPNEIIDFACKTWGKDGFLLNQTFHKSLGTVINSSIENLFYQQVLHYFTTYGLEQFGLYNENNVYIPHEKLEVPGLEEDIKLVKIEEISIDSLKEKLWMLCTSSIALSKNSIENIMELSDYIDISKDNIESITNKEIKAFFYKKLDIVPEKPEEFVRYLIYCLTENTLLIKDPETLFALKESNKYAALHLFQRYIEEYDIKNLAAIFNRFKPIFLSLKTAIDTSLITLDDEEPLNPEVDFKDEIALNKIINKISHLSKKYHKPFKANDLDSFIEWCIINEKNDDFEQVLVQKLEHAGIWRVIKLRNYLEQKRISSKNNVYKIRNGRVWITPKESLYSYNSSRVLPILDNLIIDKLKNNVARKKIHLDENFDLKIPTSEKQFVGNIPFNSTISLDKDNLLVGIHWYNVNKSRVDLDLKVVSNEYSIGWDCDYKSGDKLVFSGDMTDAPYPNGAAEYIYIDKEIGNTMLSLKVNNYTSNVGDIEYDIIIAKGNKEKLSMNYIVNPNDILVKIPNNVIELGKAEHSLGSILINDNKIKLIFNDLCTANSITSSDSNLETVLRKFTKKESECNCDLRYYLEQAGAIITNDENCDIDLGINNLNKDSIIKLFA